MRARRGFCCLVLSPVSVECLFVPGDTSAGSQGRQGKRTLPPPRGRAHRNLSFRAAKALMRRSSHP